MPPIIAPSPLKAGIAFAGFPLNKFTQRQRVLNKFVTLMQAVNGGLLVQTFTRNVYSSAEIFLITDPSKAWPAKVNGSKTMYNYLSYGYDYSSEANLFAAYNTADPNDRNSRFVRSYDLGSTWVESSLTQTKAYNAVCFGKDANGNRILLASAPWRGTADTAQPAFSRSTNDGASFTDITSVVNFSASFIGFMPALNMFVLWDSRTGNALRTSIDGGLTWTAKSIPTTWGTVIRLKVCGGRLVGVTNTKNVVSSSDMVNWVGAALPSDLTNPGYIHYGNGITFVNAYSSGLLAYSTDYVNWNLMSMPNSYGVDAIAYVESGNYFVFMGFYESIGSYYTFQP